MKTYYLVATTPICNEVRYNANLFLFQSPYIEEAILQVSEAMLLKNLEDNTDYEVYTIKREAYQQSYDRKYEMGKLLYRIYPVVTITGPDDLLSRLKKVTVWDPTKILSSRIRALMQHKAEFYHKLDLTNQSFAEQDITVLETRFIGYEYGMPEVVVENPPVPMKRSSCVLL